MAFIEAALASTRSLLASSRSPALLSPCSSSRSLAAPSHLFAITRGTKKEPALVDVEDSGAGLRSKGSVRRLSTARLSVTEITKAEWCEKQVEFARIHGMPEKSVAMKVGCHRHVELEQELVQRVEVSVKSNEDHWAIRFLNFIFGVKQLLSVGLTRELSIVGLLEDVWVFGVIDEIRVQSATSNRTSRHIILVDTKTRATATMPSEAQKRNTRLQLMCYKYLWDTNVTKNICSEQFLEHFNLNLGVLLSDSVKEHGISLGLHLKTFEDVVIHFRELSQTLPTSDDRMILRYEFQKDNSLLGERTFEFDACWFKAQTQKSIEFLLGNREASYVTDDERFKCNFCPFARKCLRPYTSEDAT